MTWKIYIFVKTEINDKKLSKGKIAGQVGHACMRLGYEQPEIYSNCGYSSTDIIEEYFEDGEIKLIFKVDELPFDFYEVVGPTDNEVTRIEFQPEGEDRYLYTVKDTKLQEYTVLAMLSNEKIDTTEFKLL